MNINDLLNQYIAVGSNLAYKVMAKNYFVSSKIPKCILENIEKELGNLKENQSTKEDLPKIQNSKVKKNYDLPEQVAQWQKLGNDAYIKANHAYQRMCETCEGREPNTEEKKKRRIELLKEIEESANLAYHYFNKVDYYKKNGKLLDTDSGGRNKAKWSVEEMYQMSAEEKEQKKRNIQTYIAKYAKEKNAEKLKHWQDILSLLTTV